MEIRAWRTSARICELTHRKPKFKIGEKSVAILLKIDTIVRDLKFAFSIVGATERDILLQYAHDIRLTQVTLDIDIGALVSDLDQFQTLKEALDNHQAIATSGGILQADGVI